MNLQAQLNAALAGHYAIEREIGQGGMATVYLANDVRHHRSVALKLLSPELGVVLGAERFLSEIRVTANLQHPNLLPLFDSGEADGLLYYVMPFVDGETLRRRVDREKQLPVDEAVRIAIAIANALDYAHRHGVIHRDLKPENILLHDGQPLVADFGIALAVSNAGGARITQTGLSLGTPQYMSPEQAAGDRQIDGRADIYSLGAVLYEMLTGEPPHTGTTAQAIIARVLTERPRPARASRSSVPAHVDRAIDRALEKLPADRWATAREFAEALSGARTTEHGMDAQPTARRRRDRISRAVPWVVAAGSLAATAASLFALRRTPNVAASHVRYFLDLPDSARIRTGAQGSGGGLLALSPDGTQLAYVAGSPPRIYLRALDDLVSRPVPGTENAISPQFSPDGAWLAFIIGSDLEKTPIAGGPAIKIATDVFMYSWGDNDAIVIARPAGPTAGLWRVGAGGGTPERITSPDTTRLEFLHTWPFVLPGGKAVVFDSRSGTAETDSLAVVRLDDRRVVRLGLQGENPRYVADGYLLFGRPDGTVSAVRFDARRLAVSGAVTPVIEKVAVRPGSVLGGATQFAAANNGTIVYAQGRSNSQLMLLDRRGNGRPLRSDMRDYADMRFSPDGKKIAMAIQSSSGSIDIWLQDIASGTLTRLTNDGVSDRPNWTPDGHRIAWRVKGKSAAYDQMWGPWDGSGDAELLEKDAWSAAFDPTGKFFLVNTVRPGTASDIDMVVPNGTPRRRPVMATRAGEAAERVSPDGKWMAFISNKSGRQEVYVRALADSAGLHQISTDGANEPVWAPSGHELFFRSGSALLSATLALTPEFRVVRRDTLFVGEYGNGANYPDWDISPDGKWFVITKPAQTQDPPIVVVGWFDELRERMRLSTKK